MPNGDDAPRGADDVGGSEAGVDEARSVGPVDEIDDLPTVSCARCDREWTLAFELEELSVGNQALEQFALDHKRHTGHFPDDVSTWQASCRHCPETVDRLDERPAQRWARTHARHTGHDVEVTNASLSEPVVVEDKSE